MGGLIVAVVLLSAAFLALLVRTLLLKRRLDRLTQRMEDFLSCGGKELEYSVREDPLAPVHNAAAELEDRLLQTREQLEEECRRTSGLTADISHQLKTPLASLRLFCEMDSGKHLERELEQIDRMEQLIASLLELERLCADGYTFTFADHDLRPLILSAWESLAMLYPGRTLTLRGDRVLRCDPKWLGEAFGNLLKNACEHTPAGGRITITLESDSSLFTCRVSDTGGGAPDRDLPHLFDRFYRAGRQDPRGAGLGLAIVKEIIRRHHGTVRAANTAEGLCITVEIPENLL